MEFPIADVVAIIMLCGLLLMLGFLSVVEKAYKEKSKQREFEQLRRRLRARRLKR